MRKAFESIKRGVRQAIRHRQGRRVGGLKLHFKPIRTKADHRAALKEIETLMNAKAGTPEGERLDVLAKRVEAYERKRFLGRNSGSEPRKTKPRRFGL